MCQVLMAEIIKIFMSTISVSLLTHPRTSTLTLDSTRWPTVGLSLLSSTLNCHRTAMDLWLCLNHLAPFVLHIAPDPHSVVDLLLLYFIAVVFVGARPSLLASSYRVRRC